MSMYIAIIVFSWIFLTLNKRPNGYNLTVHSIDLDINDLAGKLAAIILNTAQMLTVFQTCLKNPTNMLTLGCWSPNNGTSAASVWLVSVEL